VTLAKAKQPKPRRDKNRTQWAAQFAVASELAKRGHEVAFTTGHHPMKDLLAVSPKGKPFAVDVKGQYAKNVWPVKKRPPNPYLYYIFAYVPHPGKNRFFILNQDEVNQRIDATFQSAAANKLKKKGEVLDANDYFHGVTWKQIEEFDTCWDRLPK